MCNGYIFKLRLFFAVIVMAFSVIMSDVPVGAVNERDPFVSILDQEKQEEKQNKLLLEEEKLNQEKAKRALPVVLNGIIWSDSKAVAIMNDELFGVGDEVEGYKVENIEKDTVILSWDKIRRKLLLVEDTQEKLSSKGKKINPVDVKEEPSNGEVPFPGGVPFGTNPVNPENTDAFPAIPQE